MADIELVIKIPEEIYQEAVNSGYSHLYDEDVATAVAEGIPLPKGHGRLIDADALADGMEDDYEFCEAVNATPTIIKADKE